MTNYNLKPIIPPSLAAQQKKEERRKVLEAVRERRKQMYKSFQKKMQLQSEREML
jgi:hypothetical protein